MSKRTFTVSARVIIDTDKEILKNDGLEVSCDVPEIEDQLNAEHGLTTFFCDSWVNTMACAFSALIYEAERKELYKKGELTENFLVLLAAMVKATKPGNPPPGGLWG